MKITYLNRLLAFGILAIMSFGIFLVCNFYLSRGYENCLNFLFLYDELELKKQLLCSVRGKYLYDGMKVFPVLIYIWLTINWIDFFLSRKRKFTKWIYKISDGILKSINTNKIYLLSLNKYVGYTLFSLLAIQFLNYGYFLIQMPLSYDEWWSYSHFSGRGFWISFSRYPLPNNHVLYNSLSSLLFSLPIDIEILFRIPSLVASVLCSYLFFKICRYCFSSSLSLFLLVLLIGTYPFIMYGFQARGYSFVCFFTVLLIYSTIQLLDTYKNNNKYRFLLILSLIAGHLSVPTFLYAFLPVIFSLSLFLLNQKRYSDFKLLVRDNLISGIGILVSYLMIFIFNDLQNLTNPNGGNTKFKVDSVNAIYQVIQHYLNISSYLTGFTASLFLILFAAFLVIYYSWTSIKAIPLYVSILSCIMLVSPLILVTIHGVLPFERTWLYLIFPTLFCIGAIFKPVLFFLKSNWLKKITMRFGSTVFILFILLSILFLHKFSLNYHKISELEFQEDELGTTRLKPFLPKIKKIAYTDVGSEFHVGDYIYGICFKQTKDPWISNNKLDKIENQDILIIHGSKLKVYISFLKPYYFVQSLRGDFLVFAKKSLATTISD